MISDEKMTNYLDRYKAGEHLEVWTDLALLGDEMLAPPHYPQVLAVAQAAMREATATDDECAEVLGLAARALARAERLVALPTLLRILHTDDPSLLRFILATFVEELICWQLGGEENETNDMFVEELISWELGGEESSSNKGELTPAYERLISLLKHNDQGVRLGATQLLGRLGPQQAVAELAMLLNDEDAMVRRWAVYGLENLQATDALITALDHHDSEVRRQAISRLGAIKGEQAVKPILSRLYDAPDDAELTTIAQTLRRLGDRPEDRLGGRRAVVANFSTDEINELLQQLFAILERKTATAETREPVMTLIGMIGGAKIAGMFASELGSNNISLRQSVIRGLVATDSEEAIAALQHIADSDSGERGLEARDALAEMSYNRNISEYRKSVLSEYRKSVPG